MAESRLINKTITIQDTSERCFTGKVIDLEPEGGIVLKMASGDTKTFINGDVIFIENN